MYGNTEQMADYIGSLLGEKGIPVKTYDVSKTHVSYLLSDIWKYKGLVLGTCAYNTQMHPMMEHLCNEIKLVAPKNKILSIFGSSSWNGAGVKALLKYAPEMGMEVSGTPLEIMGSASYDKLQQSAAAFVEEFVKQL
jgi:flavorubredoxin